MSCRTAPCTRSVTRCIPELAFAVLGCLGLSATTAEVGTRSVEGVQVVPHVQPTELRYRQKPDFSLGARVEVFDIGGGWVHDTSGGVQKGRESEAFHKTLRRASVNTAHIHDLPGYTDQSGPDGLHTRFPLKYFADLKPIEHYNPDALLPRIHAVESLGESQYGGGKPVPPRECWKALSPYAPTRLPTSLTRSEERVWRFDASLSDYPHYDAYRITAPSADAWGHYDRWDGPRIRWGSPLETIGEMSRWLRELNRPRPVAYWSQGAQRDWEGYGRERGSPTPGELRLQAYHR